MFFTYIIFYMNKHKNKLHLFFLNPTSSSQIISNTLILNKKGFFLA